MDKKLYHPKHPDETHPPRFPNPGAKPGEYPIRNLSVLGYAQGFTLWHYRSASLKVFLAEPSALLAQIAWDQILPGDHMHISGPDGGALCVVRPGQRLAVMSYYED